MKHTDEALLACHLTVIIFNVIYSVHFESQLSFKCQLNALTVCDSSHFSATRFVITMLSTGSTFQV